MGDGFVCGTCGKAHAGLPKDWAWKLPDEVWAIPEQERAAKAKFDSGLCKYGDHFFIRCVLAVQFNDEDDYFGWGVWSEVDRAVF
jgi:hypothetical protein